MLPSVVTFRNGSYVDLPSEGIRLKPFSVWRPNKHCIKCSHSISPFRLKIVAVQMCVLRKIRPTLFDGTRVWLHRKICRVVKKLLALLPRHFASPITEIVG